MLRAARAVGPATRPMQLFYGMSQAGRALAAAHGEEDSWSVRGHGLTQEAIADPVTLTAIRGRPNVCNHSVVP